MRGDMKVTITLWMVALTMIAIAGAAQAQVYMPQPVNGKVVGVNVANLPIKMTNMRTQAEQFYTTNGAGEWLFDAANFDSNGGTQMRYAGGDVFRLEIESCADVSPECTMDVTYPDDVGPGGNIFVVFDLTDVIVPCPSQPDPQTCPPVTTCPTDTTPYAECNECCEEPEDPNVILQWLLASAAAGAVVMTGWLLKVKISRSGDDAFSKELASKMSDNTGFRAFAKDDRYGNDRVLIKHYHPGIVGYHSPDVVHNKVSARHEKGQLIV